MKYVYSLLLLLAFIATSHAQAGKVDTVYTSVDTAASFPGGTMGWTQYLIRNLVYPPAAMNQRIIGQVTLQFVVNEKGKLSDITALTGPEILQKEGIRLMKNSPRWAAAIKNGEKVKSYQVQRISFRLEGALYNN